MILLRSVRCLAARPNKTNASGRGALIEYQLLRLHDYSVMYEETASTRCGSLSYHQ